MQLSDSVAVQVTQDDTRGMIMKLWILSNHHILLGIVSEFVKAYYQGQYSGRSKFYNDNARYVQHNGQVFVGRNDLNDAFTDFDGISKISIKTDNRVVTARNEILLQLTGIYVVNDIEYPFAEALILAPVGQKRYAISDGVFKWIGDCPETFLFKDGIIQKNNIKNNEPTDTNEQNGKITTTPQPQSNIKASPSQPRGTPNRSNNPTVHNKGPEHIQNDVNGTFSERHNGNDDSKKFNRNKKRFDSRKRSPRREGSDHQRFEGNTYPKPEGNAHRFDGNVPQRQEGNVPRSEGSIAQKPERNEYPRPEGSVPQRPDGNVYQRQNGNGYQRSDGNNYRRPEKNGTFTDDKKKNFNNANGHRYYRKPGFTQKNSNSQTKDFRA